MLRQKADIGIAWDGDADRCFFIDGTGEFIAGDFVTALLAQAFLLKQPGATIIYDLRASYAVKDIVAAHGGKALMNRVGHAFIKRRMREDQRGLRRRGHRALLLPRQLLRRQRLHPRAADARADVEARARRLHELLAPLREKYFISGEINTKLPHMDHVAQKLDGHREEVPRRHAVRGWTASRSSIPTGTSTCAPSNTEPLLRLNLEATTPETMAAKRDEVLALIRS